jgi:hypothetical protein
MLLENPQNPPLEKSYYGFLTANPTEANAAPDGILIWRTGFLEALLMLAADGP